MAALPTHITVPVYVDTVAIRRQLEALRLLCSQVGFALDTALLSWPNGCASCGAVGTDDNELITDDEGTVFCEECYNP